jgi:hypothetical protein
MAVTNSYADKDHLQALIGGIFLIKESSTPSTAECEGFLDQTAADIDGILTDRGYPTVPATGATDVLMLRKYTTFGAAVMTYYAAFGHNDAPNNVLSWLAQFEQFMDDLASGKRRLINQSPRGRAGVLRVGRYVG